MPAISSNPRKRRSIKGLLFCCILTTLTFLAFSCHNNAKGAEKMTRLTAKQEAFAQLVAKGKNQVDAYIDAYYPKGRRYNESTVNSGASKLANNEKIKARIKEIKKDNPDLIWVVAPCNSLIKEARKYITNLEYLRGNMDANMEIEKV